MCQVRGLQPERTRGLPRLTCDRAWTGMLSQEALRWLGCSLVSGPESEATRLQVPELETEIINVRCFKVLTLCSNTQLTQKAINLPSNCKNVWLTNSFQCWNMQIHLAKLNNARLKGISLANVYNYFYISTSISVSKYLYPCHLSERVGWPQKRPSLLQNRVNSYCILMNNTSSDCFIKQFSDVPYKAFIQGEIFASVIPQNVSVCFHHDLWTKFHFTCHEVLSKVVNKLVIWTLVFWPMWQWCFSFSW